MKGILAALVLTSLLAGCGPRDPSGIGGNAENGDKAAPLLAVAPDDFVALPCIAAPVGVPCSIVMAGGKSLLFGVPEGAHGSLLAVDVTQPDGVFLFSLEGQGMEGLIRLRNQTWLAGREARLPVAGPDGTVLLLAYLDKGLERSDALSYVRHKPPGRFDTALFAPLDIVAGEPVTVFDSGDLSVSASLGPGANVDYRINYADRTLELKSCPPPSQPPEAQAIDTVERSDLTIACRRSTDGALVWPLERPGVAIEPS